MMIAKVKKFMDKHHMIREQDIVVAGVSGGADSVCLFLQLLEYKKIVPFTLAVVHVNHMIREDANADEEYVKNLCAGYEIPFHPYRIDIQKIAKENNFSTEEAGRIARYEAFENTIRIYGKKGKIAVAHNQNDNAETMLFHLFRGSKATGLSGILPVRDNIIRPILCLDRTEIENYLTEQNISWCIDSTNAENTYTRNKIRNTMLPFAEKEICANATKHVAEAAEDMANLRDYLQEVTDRAYELTVEKADDKVLIKKEAFLSLPEYIKGQLILRVLEELTPHRKDLESAHVEAIKNLFSKEGSKQIDLPYGLTARCSYDEVILGKKEESGRREFNFPMETDTEMTLFEGWKASCKVFDMEKDGIIPEKTYTKWFDYDKITSQAVFRNRRQKDYLTINALMQKKNLKDYFITEKVPKENRDACILLADGSHIMWVVGMRISEAYKITENTKRILEVTLWKE